MSDWKRTDDELPEKGVVVHTISPGGIESKLKRGGENGRLWFLADSSMYVYYTPEFWKEIN